ncbi:MAG: ABC transporter permease subunit, partial [candidate division Zixibacteria bacterium]|nr:ABC transporter permease subunit [candidate division Zixibacteria bacterium]NIS45154.1 ABC transporter permease subunit [candidate division Zixibacteria bacterium]NIU13314.1 ABC transporter permease subunit [candidate division Zixibacteria bacterium]NIV05312.1 ABC transporter permease subunit [candidate division Zixibacteria bacterium]NIW44133.1 ABC transporter permease subunit [Gammaproteobacteria bacterium]
AVQKVLLASSLPVVTYVLMSYSEIMMIMRTSMEDILNDDFINVARAKGIPDRLIRDKHALRNAILPVLSRLVVTIPYMLTGIVILEYTFDWPGMGRSL